MTFGSFLFIACFLAVVYAIYMTMRTNEKQKDMEAILKDLPGFTSNQFCMGLNGMTAIAVDEGRQKICFLSQVLLNNVPIKQKIYSYKDLLSSEVYEDGDSVSKTIRSGSISRAIVGGALFGGVGAIVGGMSGSAKTTKKVSHVSLRVNVNDTTNPTHEIVFLGMETTRGSILFKDAIKQAKHWHSLVAVLIKRADADEPAQIEEVKQSANSLADELKKLASLRDEGILTEEEFQQQKSKMLLG